jgi:ABC-2 type transport system ATP-binding protein
VAEIFGLDCRRDRVEIHARLGNLPGDFAYDPRLTGRQMIGYFAELRGMRGLGRVHELAERFEADLERPLGQLSRGNRQKVGLIQAAFHDPDLLLLDEPTTGLDPLMQEEFLDFVAEQRDRGCTVLLSSHELDEVEHACDRVGIIREGRLVAVEDVAEITGRSYRHVTVSFAAPVAPREFAALPGVTELEVEGTRISFKARGDLDAIVKTAARHTVVDLELVHPTLEEVFLTYYGHQEGG